MVSRARALQRRAVVMQIGLWSPVCGGWLRTQSRAERLDQSALAEHAARADAAGYDFYYVPEHYLNAVYGPDQDVADAWVTAAAAAARTRRMRVITAVQPGFRSPAVTAKMGASIAALRPGAFGLSVMAGWWRLQSEMYGDGWLDHAERYRRAGEYLDVVRGLWSSDVLDYEGRHYRIRGGKLRPRPEQPPPVFVAGESDAALDLAARRKETTCSSTGTEVERVQALGQKVKRLARERHGRTIRLALSAFGLLRDSTATARADADRWLADADRDLIGYFEDQMDGAVVAHNRGTSVDRIEANLGLSSGLVGDASAIVERIRRFEEAGVDAILVKLEGGAAEAERFARAVIRAP